MKWKTKVALAGLGGFTVGLVSREAARKFLTEKLIEIPGVPAKVGQILSMGEVDQSFNAKSLNVETILDLIKEDCPKLYEDLLEIDEAPQVASLSQVHKATLKNGKEVAIKIQFPNIRKEMDEQIDSMFFVFEKYGPGRKQNADLSGFRDFFKSSLLNELDYRNEARAQKLFFEYFKKYENIIIPKIYSEYCSDIVLTQSYEKSEKLEKIKKMPDDVRDAASRSLILFQLESIFNFGIVHGDLHAGNWGYDIKRNCLVIYDFGSTQELSAHEISAFKEVLKLKANAPSSEYLSHWGSLGFDIDQLLPISDKLNGLTAIFREPFYSASFRAEDWKFSEKITHLLDEYKWNFRLSGPPWFLGLMKSCQGVVSALVGLKANQNINRIYEEVVVCVASEQLTAEQKYTLPTVHSQFLKVQVIENGEEIVALEFPATSAARLNELIPADALQKIIDSGIDVSLIAKTAAEGSFSRQVLFEAKIDRRIYKVWLD